MSRGRIYQPRLIYILKVPNYLSEIYTQKHKFYCFRRILHRVMGTGTLVHSLGLMNLTLLTL